MNQAEKTLHFVAFDVPYPANYGGIVDVLYKLKSLHQQGIKIIFHCFYYRGHNRPNDELKNWCAEIYYYKRKQNIFRLLFSFAPYIVSSRKNKMLLNNLLKVDAPILFDGLHTTFYLDHPSLAERMKFVRLHNIEHTYYLSLSAVERNWFKRFYLRKEAERLHGYESVLKLADAVFPIAKMDIAHFEKYTDCIHIPPFFNTDHAKFEVNKSGVQGKFILFQGNLRIRENELAAKFIINQIAPLIKHKIVIAGNKPSQWLINEASIEENVQMIESPSSVQMDSLIQYAHINLLITFQQTGIKLKLIHALENGKHVLINSKMNDDDLFNELCEIKDDPKEMAKKIEELMKIDFTQDMKDKRDQIFRKYFDNNVNAKKISERIFGE